MGARIGSAQLIDFHAVALEIERRRMEADLEQFVRGAWAELEPQTPLLWNWHLSTLCGYLQALYEGRLRDPRLIVNIPPGTMKSLLVAVLWPSWIWSKEPGKRVLASSNDGPLVLRDNLKMRQLVTSEWYVERWGSRVVPDAAQWDKGLYQNTAKGFRQAVTIKGSVTGKRGDVQIVDDPHDAKKAFNDAEIKAGTDGWDQGMSTRVNDMQRSLRVLVMQRLRTNDLTGHLLSKRKQNWVHIKIPMEYEGAPGFDPVADIGPEAAHLADPRREIGELLDPVRFPRSAVESLKEDLGDYGTAGQLQQRPSPLSGGILKSKWWRVWGRDGKTKGLALPQLLHVFASWDTAFTEEELRNNAYSARTRWGVFYHEDLRRHALLLLGRWYERCDYPDLLKAAREETKKRLVHPGDAHLIERKASGISLIQHMRKDKRLVVRGYDPKPDGDKVSRAYLAQRLLKRGLVWVPSKVVDGKVVPMAWAQNLIDLVAAFPTGEPPCADLTDTVTQALLYLERRHWVHHPDDDWEEDRAGKKGGRDEDDLDEDETPKTKRVGYG